jgi:membrane protease YdiL (CAAX protease family)
MGLNKTYSKQDTEQHNYLWIFNQDELEQRVISMQHFIATLLLTLTLYLFFLEIHQKFQTRLTTTFGMISVAFLIMLLGIIKTIKRSGFPLSVVGLTLTNSKVAIKEALIGFIPLLLLTIFLKYLSILLIPAYHNVPLFDVESDVQALNGITNVAFVLIIYVFLYVPLQELLFRGGVQGFLQILFSERKDKFIPIVVANTVFATIHLIISPLMAVIIFFPGLYWGWLFARHNNLIGVCISHALWGVSAFFILNYLDLLAIY